MIIFIIISIIIMTFVSSCKVTEITNLIQNNHTHLDTVKIDAVGTAND